MAFFNFSEIVGNLKKTSNPNNIKKFLKRAIVERYVELLVEKDFCEEKNFSFEDKLEVQHIGNDQTHLLEEFCKQYDIPNNIPIRFLKDHLNNGCEIFIAWQRNNIVGYTWWANNRMDPNIDDFVFKYVRDGVGLNDDFIYGVDLFIAPQYRGGNTATEFLYKVFLALSKLGYSKAFGGIYEKNTQARWLWMLLGFKEIETITVRRFFLFIYFANKTMFLKIGTRYLYNPLHLHFLS